MEAVDVRVIDDELPALPELAVRLTCTEYAMEGAVPVEIGVNVRLVIFTVSGVITTGV